MTRSEGFFFFYDSTKQRIKKPHHHHHQKKVFPNCVFSHLSPNKSAILHELNSQRIWSGGVHIAEPCTNERLPTCPPSTVKANPKCPSQKHQCLVSVEFVSSFAKLFLTDFHSGFCFIHFLDLVAFTRFFTECCPEGGRYLG